MSDMCNYLENKLIDHVLRNSVYTSPTTIYVALLTDDPTEEGDTTYEVSGGSYVRQSAIFDEPEDGVTRNTYDIEFPQATADWGEITHVLLIDAQTGGNPLFHKGLISSIVNETFTSSLGTAVPLTQDNISTGSEVVANSDGTGKYFRGRDYTIDYANGIITALSSGAMVNATDYLISFDYINSKTITTDDIFRIPIGELAVKYE